MAPTWSKHGPDMVLKSRHSVDIGLRPCLLSLEKFSALAGLEVKLGQTWSENGPDMVQKIHTPWRWFLDHVDLVLNYSAVAGL